MGTPQRASADAGDVARVRETLSRGARVNARRATSKDLGYTSAPGGAVQCELLDAGAGADARDVRSKHA